MRVEEAEPKVKKFVLPSKLTRRIMLVTAKSKPTEAAVWNYRYKHKHKILILDFFLPEQFNELESSSKPDGQRHLYPCACVALSAQM